MREQLIETVINFDEGMTLKYLEEGVKPNKAELRNLVRTATLSGQFFPVFCGSAYQDVRVNLLIDEIVDFLPSPADVNSLPIYSAEKKGDLTVLRTVDYLEPCSYLALAFKVVVDQYGSILTFIRVYAGKLVGNSFIYNSTKDKEERVSALLRINADSEQRVELARAGEIVAIRGLKYTRTGDTFSSERKKPIVLESIVFDKPVVSQAIIPQTSKDGEKTVEALKQLCIEDPSLIFSKDEKTGQIIVEGMGELHLEVLVENLRRRFKLNLITEPPKISYRETFTKSLKTTTRYKKQSGGHGHFAEVTLFFEPNPDKGFEYVNKIRGEAVSKNYAEAVGKGLKEALSEGLLFGYPVVDAKITLLDGVSHTVDSSEKDFKQVAMISCRENKEKLGITLLEPVMDVVVTVPKEHVGDVLANLGSLRMIIENTEEEEGLSRIFGKAPLEKMISYSTTLRQLTKGRGKCVTSFSHYQQVPSDFLEKK